MREIEFRGKRKDTALEKWQIKYWEKLEKEAQV
jgi:hypothetical protein